MREQITAAMKAAMLEKNQTRLATLRLVNAAIKDRDIAKRGEDGGDLADEAEILQLLGKMIKQREDSARIYEEGGRLELAERERAEIAVIQEFLPQPLTEDEIKVAVDEAIRSSGAETIRDMGKAMAALKSRYAGRMDFGDAGARLKAALGVAPKPAADPKAGA